MNRPRLLITLLLSVALIGVFVGCDPKFTGPSSEGDPGGGGGDPLPVAVAPEARTVASIVTMHVDIMAAAFTVSAAYDSASGGAPLPRFLSDGCISVTLEDAQANLRDLTLDGCTDANGTSYSGGGTLIPLDAEDGYYFQPVFDSVGTMTASNSENPEYHHWYNSGTLQFVFNRSGANVTSIGVENFLRHDVADETVTFAYDGVEFAGDIGSHASWPSEGGVIRVGWDSVGIFDVTFSGSSVASFPLGGVTYDIDLSDGSVQIQVL